MRDLFIEIDRETAQCLMYDLGPAHEAALDQLDDDGDYRLFHDRDTNVVVALEENSETVLRYSLNRDVWREDDHAAQVILRALED